MSAQLGPSGNWNAARLRHEIDSGRTGDKVAWSDPAAAPLGTDEEAAGQPVSAEAAGWALSRETARAHHALPRQHGLGSAWLLVLLIIAAAAALAGVLIGAV